MHRRAGRTAGDAYRLAGLGLPSCRVTHRPVDAVTRDIVGFSIQVFFFVFHGVG